MGKWQTNMPPKKAGGGPARGRGAANGTAPARGEARGPATVKNMFERLAATPGEGDPQRPASRASGGAADEGEESGSQRSDLLLSIAEDVAALRQELKTEFQTLKSEVQSLRARVQDLERHLEARESEVDTLRAHLVNRDAVIEGLVETVDELETDRRRPNLILSGPAVPPRPNTDPHEEDVTDTAVTLMQKMLPTVQVEKRDLTDCIRIGGKRILCRFARAPVRNAVYEKRLSLRKDERGQERGENDRLFINEDLSPKQREIFHALMEEKKARKIWTVFSRNGAVFCKTSQHAQKIRVTDVRQISQITQ